MIFNEELTAKYNKPAPRYTSYPPANYFQAGMTTCDCIEQIEASNSELPQNISLYFHIPYCTKRCFYCGCNAYAMAKPDAINRYVDTLVRELKFVSKFLDKSRKVSQIHFGGGTPNSLNLEQLGRIMCTIQERLECVPEPEIAIECNPAYLDEDYIEGLSQLGFNRFSLGIQDFSTQVLKAVNRDPSKLPVEELMKTIRTAVPSSTINLDFIYGLPYQNPDSFGQTIAKAITLRPDRMVTFSYAHMPSIFKAQKVFDKMGLPSPAEKMQMFQQGFQQITDNGYRAIGFDHYALENDELSKAQKAKKLHRNFQGYCTRKTTGQVYAFGVSGISQLENCYVQNSKSIPEYIKAVDTESFAIEKAHLLTREQKIVREAINELMCNLQIDFNAIEDRLKLKPGSVQKTLVLNSEVLDQFSNDDILDYTDSSISLKEQGMLFIRNVAAAIDPLMQSNTNPFSKTV